MLKTIKCFGEKPTQLMEDKHTISTMIFCWGEVRGGSENLVKTDGKNEADHKILEKELKFAFIRSEAVHRSVLWLSNMTMMQR